MQNFLSLVWNTRHRGRRYASYKNFSGQHAQDNIPNTFWENFLFSVYWTKGKGGYQTIRQFLRSTQDRTNFPSSFGKISYLRYTYWTQERGGVGVVNRQRKLSVQLETTFPKLLRKFSFHGILNPGRCTQTMNQEVD